MLQFLLSFTDETAREKVEKVYNKYYNYMIKCATTKLKLLGRSNYFYEAEDAVQNAFIKITRYIDNIDFSRGDKDVKNYCLAILNNEICNVISDYQECFEFDEDFYEAEECNFIDELEMQEEYEKIISAIEALDTKYSTTLQLIFSRGMTPNEIAKLMEISPKTVYTRLARGKKILLESLKGGK